jgi:hypothetical protein
MQTLVEITDLRNYFRDFLHWDEYFRLLQVNRSFREYLGGLKASKHERRQVLERFIMEPLVKRVLGNEGVAGFYRDLKIRGCHDYVFLADHLTMNYWNNCQVLERYFQQEFLAIGDRMGFSLAVPAPNYVNLMFTLAQNGVDRLAELKLPEHQTLAFPGLKANFDRTSGFEMREIYQVLQYKTKYGSRYQDLRSLIAALTGFMDRPLVNLLATRLNQDKTSVVEVVATMHWELGRFPGWVIGRKGIPAILPKKRHKLVRKLRKQLPSSSSRKRKWRDEARLTP